MRNNLLVALSALVFIGSLSVATAQEQPTERQLDLDRFAGQIAEFERKDAQRDAADKQAGIQRPAPTVFVGSSTFARWRPLESIFRRFHAINRGFGGSTIPEITHFAKQVVCKYNPARIVFYAGTNDIGELHHTGRQVYLDFRRFVRAVHADLPGVDIYFVSMSVAPSRVQWTHEYNEGNRLIQEFARYQRHVHFVDVTHVMHDERGQLRDEFFDPTDHLHMSEAGYAAWTPIIRTALERRGRFARTMHRRRR